MRGNRDDRDDTKATHTEMITAYVSMLVALASVMYIVYSVIWGWTL